MTTYPEKTEDNRRCFAALSTTALGRPQATVAEGEIEVTTSFVRCALQIISAQIANLNSTASDNRSQFQNTQGRKIMAPSAPQVFKGITPEQYALLIAKAKTAGIDIAGNNGTASKFGV